MARPAKHNIIPSMIFGELTTIQQTYKTNAKGRKYICWVCKCSCGKTFIAFRDALITGNTKSCGCKHRKPQFKDITGERFERLVVKNLAYIQDQKTFWNCLCDCGNTKVVPLSSLRNKGTRSCGCLSSENITKHGGSQTIEYQTWEAIKQRCENPKNVGFHNYGGRGIKICAQWSQNFEAFLADMGYKPSPNHSIERIDVNGHYEPSNCVWLLNSLQSGNMRKNILITINGITHHASEWARIYKISRSVIYWRLNHDWEPIKAVITPLKSSPKS